MDFHHPLFESLALPLLLSFASTGLLRAVLGADHGRRWAAAGVAPAIIVSSAWVLGWQLWPGNLTEQLPWIYAAAALLGVGLAAVAFMSGSALLFELGLSIAAAIAGCALWLWPKARIGFGASGAVVSVIAWLTLAQGVALLTTVRLEVLLLLAGALLAGPMVRGARRGLRPAIQALVVAGVAALWVAAAIALALQGEAHAPSGGQDDPYYTPRW